MFSCKFCEIFKNTFLCRSPLVRLLPKIWEMSLFNKVFSLQLRLCLRLIYFRSYSFATSMAKMFSDIHFRNVSLATERTVSWKNSLVEIVKNQAVALWSSVPLLKRDSGTGDFLWILRNSQEHLFYRKPPDDCFWTRARTIFSIFGQVFAKWIFFNQTQAIF